jgi:hypothetical protein
VQLLADSLAPLFEATGRGYMSTTPVNQEPSFQEEVWVISHDLKGIPYLSKELSTMSPWYVLSTSSVKHSRTEDFKRKVCEIRDKSAQTANVLCQKNVEEAQQLLTITTWAPPCILGTKGPRKDERAVKKVFKTVIVYSIQEGSEAMWIITFFFTMDIFRIPAVAADTCTYAFEMFQRIWGDMRASMKPDFGL